MSHKVNDEFITTMMEKRELWLESIGRTEDDVMEDKDGEYVFVEGDTGHPKDPGYLSYHQKTYLPDEYQKDAIFRWGVKAH